MTLEERIGYQFKDRELLKNALTHSSYLNEHHLPKTACNERLEFLGDAVLETVSSEYLYLQKKDSMEGDLSKTRAALVCEDALFEKAMEIGLGNEIILGKGMEKGNGRTKPSILSDALEALIAAIYLDGGFSEARKFIRNHVVNEKVTDELLTHDTKTILQEIAQRDGKQISYRLLSELGPEHDKIFKVEVQIDGRSYGIGTGRSKKDAEMNASQAAVRLLDKETK